MPLRRARLTLTPYENGRFGFDWIARYMLPEIGYRQRSRHQKGFRPTLQMQLGREWSPWLVLLLIDRWPVSVAREIGYRQWSMPLRRNCQPTLQSSRLRMEPVADFAT
jgi:hypothetical protein